MADEWTRGPTQHLPVGFARYCIVYRVRLGSRWKLHKLEATAKIEPYTERKLAAEVHARLETKGKRFDILDVKCLGTEVPIAGGNLVTEKEWDEMKRREREQFTEKDIEDRAKELGLYIPKGIN